MSLPAIAVRRPVTTAMACLAVVLLGLVSFGELAVDLLPDVSTPRITVLTRAPSLAPPETERLVTVPLEQAVSTVAGVERIASVSREGMSVVTVSFPWGVELDLAALHVREAVDSSLDRLPGAAERPAVLRWDPGSEPVMGVAVAGTEDLGALRDLAAAVIGPRLEQAEGIAGAQVTGGAEREIQVFLDPERLTLHGLSVDDVDRALRAANVSMPGGTVLRGDYRYTVRALGEFRTPQEIADVPLRAAGNPGRTLLRLRDVGEVAVGTRPREAGALLDGRPAVGVLLYKEAGSNTVEAVAAATAALDDLRAQYQDLTLAVAFENASFISDAISSVVQNIALGGVLAFAVLFLFLRDPRNPVLLGVSIPVSIIATFAMCFFAGISLNIMTLGGLALGVGMLVDNSIVVLENIFRHREEGSQPAPAAVRGAEEVGMAVTASTLTTIAVFLPIAYVHGVAGQLFAAQAWTVTFALLASLVVSLSVLPMLAAHFFRVGTADATSSSSPQSPPSSSSSPSSPGSDPSPSSPASPRGRSARTVTAVRRFARRAGHVLGRGLEVLVAVPLFWARAGTRLLRRALGPISDAFQRSFEAFADCYHRTLAWALDHKGLTTILAILLVALGALVSWRLPWELMPPVDSGRFEVEIEAPTGTPFPRLEERVRRLDEVARGIDGVASTFATVGVEAAAAPGAAAGAAEMASNRARLTVVLAALPSRPEASAERAMTAVRTTAAELGDLGVVVDPQRSPLQRLLGLEDSGFQVEIVGDDLEVLEELARATADALRPLAGIADVKAHVSRGNPEIRLRVLREQAARYEVPVEAVTRSLLGALQGTLSTQFAEFDRRIDIRISARAGGDPGASLDSVLSRTYPTPRGPVPLRELVEARVAAGPTEIRRIDRARVLPVTATLDGIRLSDAVERVEPALAGLEWPSGYRHRIAGEQREVQASFRSLIWALGLATLLVYMVMAAQFESLRHPFAIMLTLPLGWVGVMVGLAVTGLSLNVVALIGAVVLTGIVVNDGIIKIDTINRLRADGMERRAAVLRGSELRLRPIVMTTITTICGLLPLALGLGAGAELQQPLGIAVIGGEFTATLLTLIMIPVAYEILDGAKR